MKKGSHLGFWSLVIGGEQEKRKPCLTKYGCCQSCPYMGIETGSGSENTGSGGENVKMCF